MTRTVSIRGRILQLAAFRPDLAAQLRGVDLPLDRSRALLDNVSTDEITPAWTCYWYDEELARWCLVGLRGGALGRDAVREGAFEVVVAGRSMGCGSSRETAPFALKAAGVRLVVAKSFEKIFRQNCENVGLLATTDFELLRRLARGE